ncbi:MAG: hypothetical protein WAP03_27510 [Methylorubrum rhodinum]|uniref:PGN_0703 family putative restriction endonuclease n=1 Tax=Methylorubrum rhodinum TaxID=29428 RepID=UPI003BB1C0C2
MDRTTIPQYTDFDTLADPFELDRAPLIPEALLRQHACFIPGDTRYRAAARLRQNLLRQDLGLEPGLHRPGGTSTAPVAPLGSMLTPADAARGLNFISPEVHAFTRRSLTLREEGACVNVDRLFRNMLSSEPLVRNAFVPLALELGLATRVFSQLLPAFVHRVIGIRFETAPSRDREDLRYLGDRSAHDIALTVITPDGEPATLFVEMKYTEACQGPPARHRARYDEASREAALHRDPDAPALRSVMLEQFWRLHLLAELAVRHGHTSRAHLLVLYPRLNRHVRTATRLYATELKAPEAERTGFSALTLETFVAALHAAGAEPQARYLHHRYLNLTQVLDLVLGEAAPAAHVTPVLALATPAAASSSPEAQSSPALASRPRISRKRTTGSAAGAPSRPAVDQAAPVTRQDVSARVRLRRQ